MERIYFDKQIFSYLFKNIDSIYQDFLADLYDQKNNFLFCYSHAHLLDLKNDKTDIKYDELKFMATLVDDNYISYHAIDKETSCYLVEPLEAFKDIDIEDEQISFSSIFDSIDLTHATEEQRSQIEEAKDLFQNQKLDLGFPPNEELPKEFSETIGKILPIGNNEITFMDWMNSFSGMVQSMNDDKSLYKGVRNIVDKHINNGKFTVDYDNIDFNDDLKNSVLKKSFVDYVTNTLNPNGDKQVSDYDFYVNAYFTLDLLGISKEPSKSVRFRNVLNDAFHSYYGAFCDYVVSDDQGFLKKTKAMYQLMGIKTKVFDVQEFIGYFKILSASFEKDTNTFDTLLNNDLQNGFVIGNRPSILHNRTTITIKPVHTYLGYFNTLYKIIEDNQEFVLLTRNSNNYSKFCFYREYEGIVNRAVRLFGPDHEFKGEYDWDKENKEIREGTWLGRVWYFDGVSVSIEINKGIEKLSLVIV